MKTDETSLNPRAEFCRCIREAALRLERRGELEPKIRKELEKVGIFDVKAE